MKKTVFIIILTSFFTNILKAGFYTNSAHGNSFFGVKRNSVNFATGNCKHCHGMHKSSPNSYALFYPTFQTQTDNFCMQCHEGTTIVSSRQIINRSYSYRAGGYNLDSISSIKSAFDSNIQTSVHDLDKILTFIQSQSWNFNSNSSPCVACHNPHAVQGDPFNQANSSKSSTSRGWLLSRPSKHGSILNSDKLWGDDTGEKMSDYATGYIYQAPYRYNSITTYEPDGSITANGSNLADMNTFCLDCHKSNMQLSPYTLENTPIDWSTSGDKHGKASADGGVDITLPYSSSNTGNYCLSCTDCHEPHGAPNVFLIRVEVNGNTLSGTISDLTGKKMGYLCLRCHKDDSAANGGTVNAWQYIHHESTDAPYTGSCYWRCAICHGGPAYSNPISCDKCHLHGKDDSWLNSVNSSCYTGKKCF